MRKKVTATSSLFSKTSNFFEKFSVMELNEIAPLALGTLFGVGLIFHASTSIVFVPIGIIVVVSTWYFYWFRAGF